MRVLVKSVGPDHGQDGVGDLVIVALVQDMLGQRFTQTCQHHVVTVGHDFASQRRQNLQRPLRLTVERAHDLLRNVEALSHVITMLRGRAGAKSPSSRLLPSVATGHFDGGRTDT